MAEFTKLTTIAGETVHVNKDHILTVTAEWHQRYEYSPWLGADVGEEPRNIVIVKLVDGTEIGTTEDLNSLMYRLNKNEMEAAVDRLLAHDSNGMVVRVRK